MTRIVGGEQPVSRVPAIGGDYLVEPGDWLTANRPLDGATGSLFERQSEMFSLAKIVSGPGLRAELPRSRNEIETDFWVLEEIMNEALEMIHLGKADGTAPSPAPAPIQSVLTEFRNSCSWEISDHESGLVLLCRTDQCEQRVHIAPHQKGVRLWLTLVGRCEPDPVSLQALTHFCLGLNACLRMARASLLADSMVLEVVLGERVLSCCRLEKGVEALVVGAQFAKREAAGLLNLKVAQTYCAFHHLPN